MNDIFLNRLKIREHSHSVRNASLGRKTVQSVDLQAVGLQPFIAGCIPDGMQVPGADTFSTERYSLTGMKDYDKFFKANKMNNEKMNNREMNGLQICMSVRCIPLGMLRLVENVQYPNLHSVRNATKTLRYK